MNGRYRRFLGDVNRIEETQRQYLLKLIRKNTETMYGKINKYSHISSIREYQRAIPITDYEDYSPYIEEIAAGKAHVLTHEPVLLFEPSSGTLSSSKLIPYTNSLKVEFQRGIAPWIVSLYKRTPELMRGSAYWCISPPVVQSQKYGMVPVGFDHDAEYLGFIGRTLHSMVSAVPQEVADIAKIEEFRRETLVHLLSAENLTLISIWSPSFLTLLLKQLVDDGEMVIRLLAESKIKGAAKRAEAIKYILQYEQSESLFERIWPNLRVISCWTHGPSELYSKEVQKLFPAVEIQGKGLIATEAFVSFPLLRDSDPVLSINSHFFEFLDMESGDVKLAHQLSEGRIYSVIVTTGGGFYRYKLNDLIKVTGFIGQVPTFRFVAKEEDISDLFGEKLHAAHVQGSAVEAFSICLIEPSFYILAPVRDPSDTVSYSLFLYDENINAEQADVLVTTMEDLLRGNFNYAYCRELGQLGALKLFLIDRSNKSPQEIYVNEMQRRGLKIGDIKPAILDSKMDWDHIFRGYFWSN